MKIFPHTKNSKLLLLQVFICFLAIFPCFSFAQNSGMEKEELQKIIEGKTFWFHPTSNVFSRCRRIEFYGIGQKLSFDFQSHLKFIFEFDESILKVKINDQINATTKIDFFDKSMFVYENDTQYLSTCFSDLAPTEHVIKLVEIKKNEEERIANTLKQIRKDEEEKKANDFKKLLKAEEEKLAKNRKGGVRIGMTAKHVREKTDWGEPNSINTTITSSGRIEQWVYGDGDYLYFRNGILDAIQVRK